MAPRQQKTPKLTETAAETTGQQPETTDVFDKIKHDFMKSVIESRMKREEPPPPPPPPTQRQLERTRLEMEAGRKRVAANEEQAKLRPQPKPEPSDGTTVPVFRPQDYVPNMDQGTKLGARDIGGS